MTVAAEFATSSLIPYMLLNNSPRQPGLACSSGNSAYTRLQDGDGGVASSDVNEHGCLLSVIIKLIMRRTAANFFCAVRQRRRGNIALITTLPVPDWLDSGHILDCWSRVTATHHLCHRTCRRTFPPRRLAVSSGSCGANPSESRLLFSEVEVRPQAARSFGAPVVHVEAHEAEGGLFITSKPDPSHEALKCPASARPVTSHKSSCTSPRLTGKCPCSTRRRSAGHRRRSEVMQASASCSATLCHGPAVSVGSGSNTGPTGVPAPAVLMTVRHLQRKTVHLCPVGHHLRCVQALRAQKRRGACLRAIRTTHKGKGALRMLPLAQRVISNG